jgi:hypothetical protein
VTCGAGRGGGEKKLLLCIPCGSVPELPVTESLSEESLGLIRKTAASHKRVGLLDLTDHRFLDAGRRAEQAAFAAGTTVAANWDANAVQVHPELAEWKCLSGSG